MQIEFDYYQTPDGQIYSFHNGVNKFLMSFQGLGMPEVEYRVQRGPYQHGETLIDYVLRPRIFQLLHSVNACDRQGYWEARNELIEHLRPNRQTGSSFQPGTFLKKLPGGNQRAINVVIEEGPKFNARRLDRWEEFSFIETLRFIAYDPTFYDPTQKDFSFSVTETITDLVFPITFPIQFGVSIITKQDNLTYNGNWLSYPTINLTGPMNNPIIENDTTGEKLELIYDIPASEVVTITLDYGNKTVENGSGDNLIGVLSTDSDLATFHLAPDPEASGGINTIIVQAGDTDSNSEVELLYYERYIGI
jgi:hypothetical protein